MKKTLSLILISLLFCSVLLSAKGKAESTSSVKRPLIAVSILPQQYAVDRISGKLADTVVLVGPGQTHTPTNPLLARCQHSLMLMLGSSPIPTLK